MADIHNSSANTAWFDATMSCYNYLATETKSNVGVNCFIGDRLESTRGNLWCFITSGGREQVQNYQVPTPSYQWIMDGVLRGQFEKWEDAMNFSGSLMNNMPAYKDKDNQGQRPVSNHCVNRGIPPNVQVFEITSHPEIFSDIVTLFDKGDTKKLKQWWIIIINFRIVYNRDKT